jgi:hypothetical protein
MRQFEGLTESDVLRRLRLEIQRFQFSE